MLEIALFIITVIALTISLLALGVGILTQKKLDRYEKALDTLVTGIAASYQQDVMDKATVAQAMEALTVTMKKLVTEHNRDAMLTIQLARMPAGSLPSA